MPPKKCATTPPKSFRPITYGPHTYTKLGKNPAKQLFLGPVFANLCRFFDNVSGRAHKKLHNYCAIWPFGQTCKCFGQKSEFQNVFN